jgi:hypothetical protein
MLLRLFTGAAQGRASEAKFKVRTASVLLDRVGSGFHALGMTSMLCLVGEAQHKYFHNQINMDSSMDSRRKVHENEPELRPLEQEVLDEYAKLVGNLDDVCHAVFFRSERLLTTP